MLAWWYMPGNSLIHRRVPDTRTWRTLGLTVILVMGLLTSSQERVSPQTGSVQLKGSETLRPLLTMCAEDFMARRPHVDVIVQGGGSGRGLRPSSTAWWTLP
jgi:ABC-type phosphate transport system substrate-binding protein